MSPTTLFKVYTVVVSRREYANEAHGGGQGIAVFTNPYALRWQRLDRLAKKLEVRILRCLKEYESYNLGV